MNKKYLSITALTKYLKFKFEEDSNLQEIYIKGEISNFKAHTRGHFYFTLKDETSRISALMFSYNARNLKFTPIDGMKVLVKGKINIYEATGNYQIYVEEMIEDGVGNLYIAFEQLKEKLNKEGLFNQDIKKKIPKIPKRVGIVSAPTGAAIKDILTTIKRRFPICETILFPSLVQGDLAAKDIVEKIRLANTYDIDVLIVGRGGGSIEDLWPFNEEIVARAIYESKIPVISAVGHEIDFTISDYVADMRAPTPTAAAELAVPNMDTIKEYIFSAQTRCGNSLVNILENKKLILNKLKSSYVLTKPLAMYEIKEQKLDTVIDKINKEISIIIEKYKTRLFKSQNSFILTNPNMLYKFKEQNLVNIISKLEVLNPMNTLKRGYGIIKKDEKVISSIKNIKEKDNITINLKDGNIITNVIEVKK